MPVQHIPLLPPDVPSREQLALQILVAQVAAGEVKVDDKIGSTYRMADLAAGILLGQVLADWRRKVECLRG